MATLDQEYTSNTTSLSVGETAANKLYIAQQFTVSVTNPVDSIELYLKKVNTGGANYSVEIWSETGSNVPDTKISDTQTLISSSLTTSLAWTAFTFGTKPNLTSGNKAWIIFGRDVDDSTNYVSIGVGDPNYTGGLFKYGNDKISWSNLSTIFDSNFKEYYALPATAQAGFLNLMV